jgi:hypothetical protein
LDKLLSEEINSIENNPGLKASIKILMDISKIASVIDTEVLRKQFNISLKKESIAFTKNMRNLSTLSKEEIINSKVFKSFLASYRYLDYTNTIKDSIMYLPNYPYHLDNAIFQNGDFINIALKKQKYEGTTITTLKYLNKYSHLKSSYKSIIITDK